jgi:hypothetical protein
MWVNATISADSYKFIIHDEHNIYTASSDTVLLIVVVRKPEVINIDDMICKICLENDYIIFIM